MEKSLELRLREFLEKEFYFKKDGGEYIQECYVHYDDELSDKSIKEILESDSPMETFYDQFEPDFYDYDFNEVQRKVENEFEGYDENEEEIDEWLRENVHFYIPEGHYLNKKVCANLILDTGDGNYDYTLNNLLNGEEISDESALLWLAIQQGYTKEQLEVAMAEGEFGGSKFLKSAREECLNVTSSMNAVAFFVKMSIKDLINYKENPYTFKIDAGTSCGLVDFWNGAGGILEIQLEKAVEVPADKVRSFTIDGADGYGVDKIYCMSSSFWTE